MVSFHEDHLKMFVLALLCAFLGFGWYREHLEVRHLLEIGTSLGAGWEECLATLEPRVTGVEDRLTNALIGDVHPAMRADP